MPSDPKCARRLRACLVIAEPLLRSITELDASRSPAPGKWSPKQIVGHLVDSAANNHQRFVRAALQDELVFAGYAQEEWVAVQRYQQAAWADLLALWLAYNRHIATVMAAVPDEARTRVRAVHNLDEIATRAAERGRRDAGLLHAGLRQSSRHAFAPDTGNAVARDVARFRRLVTAGGQSSGPAP